MKIIIATLALALVSTAALAFDPATLSGKTLTCGSTTLKFGPKGETASINGRAPEEVQWGNKGQDAVIGDSDFETMRGKLTLDRKTCR